MPDFQKERKGTGTREWSEKGENIQKGCGNGCLYCYARDAAINRWKNVKSKEAWLVPEIYPNKINKKWSKFEGVIMFPTAHDIDQDNVHSCILALKNMLKPGNKVLIVSKPSLYVMNTLLTELDEYKDQIMLRFTIGNVLQNVLDVFEPFAPSITERRKSLQLAHSMGYKTSISIEPLLGDADDLGDILYMVQRFVTDDIWVGKLNFAEKRIFGERSEELQNRMDYIKRSQTDENILLMYERFKDDSQIKWKDSIKQVINAEAS